MSKYKFSQAERWAVWIVHGDICYLCDKPLNFGDMQVDHVIPEYLLDHPETRAKVFRDYGLHQGFNLNTPENWLPSHASCNRKKSCLTFRPAGLLFVYLQRASNKAAAVRNETAKAISDRRIGNALAVLETATEAGDLEVQRLIPLLKRFLELNPSARAALRLMEPAEDGGLARLEFGYAAEPPAPPTLRLTRFAHLVVTRGGIVRLRKPT